MKLTCIKTYNSYDKRRIFTKGQEYELIKELPPFLVSVKNDQNVRWLVNKSFLKRHFEQKRRDGRIGQLS